MESYKIIKEILDKPGLDPKGIQVYFAPQAIQENDAEMCIHREKSLCWMFTPNNTIKALINAGGVEQTIFRFIQLFKSMNKNKVDKLTELSSEEEVNRMILIVEKYIIDTLYDYSLDINKVN